MCIIGEKRGTGAGTGGGIARNMVNRSRNILSEIVYYLRNRQGTQLTRAGTFCLKSFLIVLKEHGQLVLMVPVISWEREKKKKGSKQTGAGSYGYCLKLCFW
jgi:hypothetical protein